MSNKQKRGGRVNSNELSARLLSLIHIYSIQLKISLKHLYNPIKKGD